MNSSKLFWALLQGAAALGAGAAHAQDAGAFYKGRTVTIVIGAAPGGGYDTYGRLVARHIGRHIPGAPNVTPANMPGAGSNTAAANLANILPRDGTQIGAIYASAMLEPLLGDAGRIKHDPAKFQNLGSASHEVYTCVLRADAPAGSIEDARRAEVILGATADGGTTVDFPLMSNRYLGTKYKVVRGYAGSREVTLAAERGEVHGACGLAWSTLSVQYPNLLQDKRFRLIAQEDMDGLPELAAYGAPVTGKLTATEADRRALDLFYSQNVLGRPFVVAAEAPRERVAALRKAFMAALADPELLAEARRLRIDVAATSGEDVEALIARLYATPREIVESVRSTLGR
ncbi:MAG: efflux transporter protein [Hyphomicrobiales bacterium]|nr:efflux transporter protein [Hyphomicrobiales bacterium]